MSERPAVHELAEGQYVVLGDTWIVGKRYKIQGVVGKGSYGAVRDISGPAQPYTLLHSAVAVASVFRVERESALSAATERGGFAVCSLEGSCYSQRLGGLVVLLHVLVFRSALQ